MHATAFLLAVSAAWLATAALQAEEAQPSEEGRRQGWQVGFAEAHITPANGEAMLAGFGRPRQVDGTLAPLRAQALAMQDREGRRAILFTADVLGFSRDTIEALRWKIEKAHGIPPHAVCLTASHTHWGPAINYRINFTLGGLNPWYVARLEETLLKLADEALQNLAPAEIAYGACEAQIGMCRRLPNERGQIAWGPNSEGSYDKHTPVLHLLRDRSPKQIVLVGHACHPTSTGASINRWSPDYPGALRQKLEASLDDCRALFVMGCGGDAKVVVPHPETGKPIFAARPDQANAAGEKLADVVVSLLAANSLQPLDASLQTGIVSGELSLQPPPSREELENLAYGGKTSESHTWWARQSLAYPDTRRSVRYDVQTWRLGGLTLVALEGEVCADWGPVVRRLAATEQAMVIAYANEVMGYIPTARIIREGGYEGDTSHRAYFLPAPFEPKMETELTGLLERALEQDERP